MLMGRVRFWNPFLSHSGRSGVPLMNILDSDIHETMQPPEPKVIQICIGTERGGHEHSLYALKEDGTIWRKLDWARDWVRVK